MKVRGTIVGTPLSARLTALCWGALTLLVPVAVSACTSSTSTPTIPSVSATVTGTASGTAPASSGNTPSSGSSTESGSASASGTPGVSSSPPPSTSSATPEVTVTQTITVSGSGIPPAAPVTGGGGTASFQDTLLLALGAVAILAGAGGLAYRRWLGRGR